MNPKFGKQRDHTMNGINLDLQGQKVLVTGASAGLGEYICKAFNDAGAEIGIHYNNNSENAIALQKELSKKVVAHTMKANLEEPEDARLLFQDAVDKLGEVSVLVNCAANASQSICDFADLTDDIWETTQDVNVKAPLILTQEFARQGISGSIINISSIEAKQPAKGHTHYSVSKSALESLTKASATELGGLGIRVNGIAPGLINREGIRTGWPEGVALWEDNAPLGRLVDPADVSSAAVFLASDKAKSITGTVLTVDCGLSATPSW